LWRTKIVELASSGLKLAHCRLKPERWKFEPEPFRLKLLQSKLKPQRRKFEPEWEKLKPERWRLKIGEGEASSLNCWG
jgi:hypothetical protein